MIRLTTKKADKYILPMSLINQEKRLKALESYHLIDTLKASEYDSITQLAAQICECPIALISFLDSQKQRIKSQYGISIHNIPIKKSLCAILLNQQVDFLEIEDAQKEAQYRDMLLVKDERKIRFYAGVALKTDAGETLGTLCVMDEQSKKLGNSQLDSLKLLADQIIKLLELRKTNLDLESQKLSLRHESNLLSKIIEATQVGTWVWNVQTGRVTVNRRYAEIIGYTLEELEPVNISTWNSLIHPEDAKLSDQKVQDCFDRKIDFYNIECRLIHKNGSLVWINDRGKVVEWDENGKPLLMIGTHTDITQRKTTEVQFKTINDNIPGTVFRLHQRKDGSSYLSSISRGAQNLWGFSEDQIIKNNDLIWANIHEKDLKKLRKSIAKSAKNLKYWECEWRYYHPDGTVKWHRGSGNPGLFDEKDLIWDSIVRDITAQKEAELALKIKEKRYRALVQEGADMTAILNLDGKYQYLSDNYLSITGHHPKELLGKNGFDFFHPEDVEKIKKEYQLLEKKKRVKSSPYRFLRKDGSYCWMQSVGTNLISDPNINGIVVNSIDITNLINVQKKLKQHIERFEYVNKATNDAIYECRLSDERIFWGESFSRIFGHAITGKKFFLEDWKQLLHPKDKPRTIASLNQALADPKVNRWEEEYRMQNADGSYAYVKEAGYITRDEPGNPLKMIGVLCDISLQKKEEEQLRLMENVLTQTHDAVLITDADPLEEPGPKIVFCNQAFSDMTGYRKEEVLGRSPRFLQGPKTDRKELDRLSRALKENKPCEITVINYKKDGTEFWINFTVNPITDENGKISHFLAIEKDVTQQKNEERKKQFLQSISTLFSEETSLEDSLNKACKKISRYGNLNLCEIWLKSNDQSRLILSASSYHGKATSKSLQSIEINQDLIGSVLLHKQSMLSNSSEKVKSFSNSAQVDESKNAVEELKNTLAISLCNKKEEIGVLVLDSEFTGTDKKKLEEKIIGLNNVLGVEIRRKGIEEELHTIFGTAPDIIFIVGKDGCFQKINPAVKEILEYSVEEIKGKPFTDFIHPEDKTEAMQVFKEINSGMELNNLENRYITKSGKVKWLSWSATPPIGKQGLIYSVARDITEKKELKKLLYSAVNQARIGSWSIDLTEGDNPPIYCSPITCSILETENGFQPTFNEGFDIYLEGYREKIKKAVLNLLKNGKNYDLEIPILTKKNNVRWVRSMGHGEFINNQCVKIYGSFQDIHQQKIAKIELENTFEERNAILESIRDAFFAMDRSFNVIYCNKEAEKILQFKRDQLIGKKIWDIHPFYTEVHFYTYYYQAFKEKRKVQFEEYYADLNRWFEVSIFPSKLRIAVYFKDISERKKAEEKIRASNERFEKVSEATQDAIWEWNIQSDKLYWGIGYSKLFGYKRKEQVVKLNTWKNYLHPEDIDRIQQSLENALKDDKQTKWEEYYRFRKADGSYAYVADRGVIIRDEDGDVDRMVGALSDISMRIEHEKELKKLNQELENHTKELAESNAELEQFAYIASHDLQEPLRMVSSFLTQLDKKYHHQLDEKAQKYIEFAVDGAKRMRQIILDLLEFSRIGKNRQAEEKVNLNQVIEEVCSLQKKMISEKRAEVSYKNLPNVISAKAPLIQVFHNLIGNALKYSRKDVPVKIIITAKKGRKEWVISVKDNGIGIEPDYYEKIFIIFQRLHRKEQFQGSGMGLAIVKKTIEKLGGQIWVESKVGYGSNFSFTIPIPPTKVK